MEFRTCQFCKKSETNLIKYGVRHYAHGRCLLEKRGAGILDDLPVVELRRMPVFAIRDLFGEDTLNKVMKRIKEDEEDCSSVSKFLRF